MALKNIKINKLAHIRDSMIDFDQLIIFTGESSTGKSYTAFLLNFLSRISTDINVIKSFFEGKKINSFENLGDGEMRTVTFPVSDFMRFVHRECKLHIARMSGNDDSVEKEIDIEIPTFFMEPEFSFDVQLIKSEIGEDLEIKFFEQTYTLPIVYQERLFSFVLPKIVSFYICTRIYGRNRNHHFFLAPSRGAIFSSTSSSNYLPTMYQEFIKDYSIIKGGRGINEKRFKLENDVQEAMLELLNGEIIYDDGKIFFEIDGHRLPLSATASSIKELAPFIIFIQKYRPESISALFEEPEVHLHPLMHQKIINLIAVLINKGSYFQITTHSDYLINQLSTLLRLSFIDDKEKREKAYEELGLSKSMVLSPKKVGAYYFKKQEDGFVKIIKQPITEDGIQFSSFDLATERMVKNDEVLDNILWN